ncbi:DUF3107 domain-containing protein [Jongsikchunia kroppenstedtii]|uniref:DUF3107 domain-containing protein n=1 Tax=Jongsikchunia kroppenstedtii TaxID=1121721 RepID=UPI00036D4DBD|nr:DUF3107 domain-containing protein [Jongsikchunia kroppenstedtii]
MTVEVKIGISDSSRELTIRVEESADAVHKSVETALSGNESLLHLTDEKGARLLVPVTKIAYIEVGASESRRVGFGSISGG